MLTVAINSATQQTSVALLEGKKSTRKNSSLLKLLSEKSWLGKKDEAEKIIPNILVLLKKAKKNWNDVENIFVIEGPGPFTGLRVGVTIANSLAWSTKSKIFTTNVFDYLCATLPSRPKTSSSSKSSSKTAIIIKAGGEFVAVFLPTQKTKKSKLVKIENLASYLKKAKITHVLAEMKIEDQKTFQKIFKEQKLNIHCIESKKLKTFGQTIPELIKKSRTISKTGKSKPAVLKPLYLQKPHITASKKEIFTHAQTHARAK